jgi:hypothetical protein
MITQPVDFNQAISFLLDKDQVPASWDSAHWALMEPEARIRAFFSAKVESARFLDRAQGLLFDYMAKVRDEVTTPDGKKTTALRVAGREHFVKLMRDFMLAEGMAKPEEFPAMNQDDVQTLGSLSRLRLIFDTNVRQSYGYGQWKQGMTPAALRAFPAARLIRKRGVAEARPRHAANIGQVRAKTDFYWWASFQNSPEIGGFGVPWGPYGFNSGVTQEDVSKQEAAALGVAIPPPPAELPGLNDGLSASTRKMSPALKAKLLAELRGGPKPADPREAARQAAAQVRREMLNRGLTEALGKGDAAKAEQYRDALAALPPVPGLPVEEAGEAIRLVSGPVALPVKAGEDIGPKLVPATTLSAAAKTAHERAMKAIDAVHGDGPLGDLPFSEAKPTGTSRAYYSPGATNHRIVIERFDHAELSIAHEVGHWLDHIAFYRGQGTAGPFDGAEMTRMFEALEETWGSYGPEFEAFMTAAEKSAAIQKVTADYRLSGRSRKYLLSKHEILARAYAQWIAIESGDAVMIGQIDANIQRAKDGMQAWTQWEWEDFELLRSEFRAIFRQRQWLRKS